MSYEDYRANKLESGKIYQDFVAVQCLHLLGLVVGTYSSQLYQYEVGESQVGAEIKHDEHYVRTGNLWIELAEKARPRPGPYAPAGIWRRDNSWLFIIGDYDTIFLFSTATLRHVAQSGLYPTRENSFHTSQGFLLPGVDAWEIAAQVLMPKAQHKIRKEITTLERDGKALQRALTKPDDPRQLPLFGGKKL